MRKIKTSESITGMLATSVATHPDAVFLRTLEGEITYEEFAQKVKAFATGLGELGVVTGDIVAAVMGNSIDNAICWFASSLIGAIHAPINTAFKAPQLLHCLQTVKPKVVITDDTFLNLTSSLIDKVSSIERLVVRDVSECGVVPEGSPQIRPILNSSANRLEVLSTVAF